MSTPRNEPLSSGSGGSQTVQRALDILELIAGAHRPLAVAEISQGTDLSGPTAHRLCRTLVDRGYLRQQPDRSYALGFKLIAIGNAANELVGLDVEAVLADLVTEIGETANLAVLSGHQAEYVAQAPARYSMRMFTEIGRRVDLHSTGVGKAMLARLDEPSISAIIRRAGLQAKTSHTLTTEVAVAAALDDIRHRGYATDEQEQELGVRCVAIAVESEDLPLMAISISGPITRMTDDVVHRAVPLLHSAARQLTRDLRPQRAD